MGEKLSDVFLQLFCEKNSDGTKHLRLKGNELYQRISTRLKFFDMPQVGNFLRINAEDIVSLDLSYNDIGDDGLKILTESFFCEENNLQHLNLMHCDIHAEGMKHFSSCQTLKLKSCRINGNKLGTQGARFIAKLIENWDSLVYIDIAETDQTLESIESILIVIEHSTLKVLDISRIIPNSYYSKYNKATLAEDLSVVLKLNETLVELHIQKCGFDGHDTEILLTGLKINKHLEVLDLGCNGIANFGVELIAKWLKGRPPLRALNISANGISNPGARALSFGLPFSKVRFMDITNNKIDDLGLTDLLDTVKKYCRMRILYLWGNKFGPKSCRRLDRLIKATVLDQEYLDVKIYSVDGELHAAYYPTNRYKHLYYSVMDYACPVELKIKRNKLYPPEAQPRALLDVTHIGRYPPVDESLGERVPISKERMCFLEE